MLGERECLSDVNSKQLFACVRRMKICRPKEPWLKLQQINIDEHMSTHNIAKGEELVPGSHPWECDGFHDGGWQGGKIHCGKHAMVSLPNSMFMLRHVCDLFLSCFTEISILGTGCCMWRWTRPFSKLYSLSPAPLAHTCLMHSMFHVRGTFKEKSNKDRVWCTTFETTSLLAPD